MKTINIKLSTGFKVSFILAALTLGFMYPSISLANTSVLFYDNFDDGNYSGWTVEDVLGASDVRTPELVPSPEGYSIRGTGSGYHPDWSCYLTKPINIQNSVEICIEMRAKSGPQWPNEADIKLVQGTNYYMGRVYGEAGENETADWASNVGRVYDDYRNSIGNRAFEWHTFAWTRNIKGWWSFAIDGVTKVSNFRHDLQLTSFDKVELVLHRNQSEIEWIRVSSRPLNNIVKRASCRSSKTTAKRYSRRISSDGVRYTGTSEREAHKQSEHKRKMSKSRAYRYGHKAGKAVKKIKK